MAYANFTSGWSILNCCTSSLGPISCPGEAAGVGFPRRAMKLPSSGAWDTPWPALMTSVPTTVIPSAVAPVVHPERLPVSKPGLAIAASAGWSLADRASSSAASRPAASSGPRIAMRRPRIGKAYITQSSTGEDATIYRLLRTLDEGGEGVRRRGGRLRRDGRAADRQVDGEGGDVPQDEQRVQGVDIVVAVHVTEYGGDGAADIRAGLV